MNKKKLSRRRFLRGAALAAAGTAVAACQPKTVVVEKEVEKEVTKIVKEVVKETVVVEKPPEIEQIDMVWYVAWGGAYGQMNEEIAQLYMDAHPEVTIETLIGRDHEALATAIAGGQPPDVAHQFWAWGRLFITQGALLDLSPYVASAEGATYENYDPAWWSMCESRGAQYMVPYLQAGVRHATFWNKTLFEEAGLDPDTPPKTIDDLVVMTEKLTKVNDAGDVEILGYNPLDYGPLNYWAPALGAEYYDPVRRQYSHNQPALLDWLTKMAGIVQTVGFDKLGAWSEGVNSAMGMSPFMAAQQAIAVSHGDWYPGTIQNQNPDLEGQYGVTYQPSPSGITAILSYTHAISIPKGTPNPNEAWKFIDWAAGSEEVSQKSYDDSGSVVPWKPWRDAQDWNAPGMKPFTQWFIDTLTDADYAGPELDPEVLGMLSSEPQRRYQSAVEAVFTGELEPAEALQRLDQELQPMLDEAIRLYNL